MRARAFVLGLAAVLCALPLLAQDIPAGDDVWDSLGGGATEVTLSAADWATLCGASIGTPYQAVQLKGFNIPGAGTGDTIVTRLDDANLPSIGSSDRVGIQLKDLSMVSDGTHPCSPKTLSVTDFGDQSVGSMTITKTSAAGGTFIADVPVSAVIQTTDGTGGQVFVNGSLGDDSASPWSYAPPTSAATTASAPPWHPAVDPVTKKKVRVCRRGNKILPARHCYWPPPPCPKPVPVDDVANAKDADAVAVPVEKCTVEAEPIGTN